MTTWPFDPALQAHGAIFTPAQVAPGAQYWRLIRADGPMDIGGNVVVFVDVLGAVGQRAAGVPVQFYWADGQDTKPTEPKPGDPRQGVSFVMGASGNAYGVRIADGKPSDSMFGMGLVAWEKHVSYQLVFQLTAAAATPPALPPIAQPPEPTDLYLPAIKASQLREALRLAGQSIDDARGIL